MRRNILLICILSVLVVGLTMTGCGKKNKDGDTSPAQAQETESAAKSEDANADNNQSVQEADTESEDTEKIYESYAALYEDFLNNQEPVYFSWFMNSENAKDTDWKYCPYNNVFNSSSAYVFSDFMEKVCDGIYEDVGEKVYPKEIKHGLLDCGKDGIPELIIEVDGMTENPSVFNDVWIIKCIDNKLQVIMYKQYGYRSQFDINEYGWYSYGGSTGAASWVIEHDYIRNDGTAVFDYGESNVTSCWALYIPDNSEYQNVADTQGIGDNIEIEQFYFEKYDDEQEDYAEYLKRSMWIYYELNHNYNRIDNNNEIYEKGDPFRIFWDATGMPLDSEDEIAEAMQMHRENIGLIEAIENGGEVKWSPLSQERLDRIYAWKPAEPDIICLEEPPWDYYYWQEDAAPTTKLKLEVENKTPNDIIDENVWFAAMGWDQPDRLNFADEKYTYKLYGDTSDGLKWYPYMMDIYDNQTGDIQYSFDFSAYYKPEIIKPGDEPFVEESIGYAAIRDDVLYVSTFHNTYAESAPQNGYITAFDMKDNFKILWRSKPLTCNSDNFIVTEDAIICGYGFTAEDDYVYVLDRECGVRTSSIKVKTGPDWFCLKDDMLFVRCYDTDYVFNVR